MTNVFLVLLGILAVAFVIFSIVCATKESSVTAKYEGVYGKLSARIATTFTFFGVVILVFSLLLVLIPNFKEGLGEEIMPTWVIFLFSAVCLGAGLFTFKLTLNKCPEELKRGCIRAMIITAVGSSLKQVFKISSKTAEVASTFASSGGGYASSYTMNGDTYQFESSNGSHVYLYNPHSGNKVTVWAHGNGGLLTDSAGNLYYPD